MDIPNQPYSNATTPGADLAATLRIPGNGSVPADGAELRRLRSCRLMSQAELAIYCEDHRFRISLPTIKRAERGGRIRFRVARELARCFDVPVHQIIR